MNSQELRNIQEAYSQVYDEGYKDLGDKARNRGHQLLDKSKTTATRGSIYSGVKPSNTPEGENLKQRASQQFAVSAFHNPEKTQAKSAANKERGERKKKAFGNRLMRSDGQGIKDSYEYQLDEAGKNDARIRGNIKSFGSNYTPPKDWDQSANRGQGAVLNAKQKEKQRRKGLAKGAMGEAVDLYDIILSHLLDEGYADTQEAAEAIMVNMSEEWREEIVEEKQPFPHKKVDRQVYDAMDSGETAGDSGDSAKEKRDYGRADRMRSVAAKHGGKTRG